MVTKQNSLARNSHNKNIKNDICKKQKTLEIYLHSKKTLRIYLYTV